MKTMHRAYQKAHEMKKAAEKMIENGAELTCSQMAEYEAVCNFCNRASDSFTGSEKRLSADEIKSWVGSMWNITDGTRYDGEHWTLEETSAVAKQLGIVMEHITDMEWWAALNAAWHDGYSTAKKRGKETDATWFADRAHDFLFDQDSSVSPSERLYNYRKYL